MAYINCDDGTTALKCRHSMEWENELL